MSAIAILLVAVGIAGTGWGTWGALTRKRPYDILFALLAPASLFIGLLGGVLFFVPDFFRP